MLPEVTAHKPCSSCGNSFSPDDLAVFGEFLVCAGCQPAFVQSYRQGVIPLAPPKELHYAGFWIRAAAWLVDTVVVGILQVSVALLVILVVVVVVQGRTPEALATRQSLELIAQALSFVSAIFYYCYFWTRSGATPGKMLFGLKVIDEGGGPIRTGQAISRWFSQLLSGFLLGYGFMKAGWSPEKRSMHDGIARTRVIYSR